MGKGKVKTQTSAVPQVPRQVDDTQKAIEEPRVLQVAGITGLWAVLEFNTEATKPSQKERRQTFSERRTNHFSTMLMEEGATILKNGYFSLLST